MSDLQNNKRIAKNTIMLYIRMIVITIISIYTTRVTLQLLGVEDFGIRNVVTGIIGFLSIITTAMVNASQRFLAYDLGKKDTLQFSRTYSMLINMFLIISVLGVFLLEIVGPIFIGNYLVIPEERMAAAQWIFQFSVIGFVISTMTIPFTSAIIACEKMDVFAYVSLIDAFLKLAVVYLLFVAPYDKLISIVLFTILAQLISNSIYIIFCHFKVQGCKYIRYWNRDLLRELFSFMGWNFFGSTTSVLTIHGLSLLLNMFFGPLINASKGIADTVNSFVSQIISNFFLAVSPQIVKTYANDDKDYTLRMVIYSSKFAFFLMALIGIPLINNMEPLLILWLGKEQVTQYMVLFSQWTIVLVMSQTFEYPITQTVRATGDLKSYQIINGLILLSFIPICYFAFKQGLDAVSSIAILIILTLLSLQYRIVKLSHMLNISFSSYYRKVIFPSLLAVIPSALLSYKIAIKNDTILMLFLSLIVSFAITLFMVISIGMNKLERQFALSFFKNKRG